MQLNKTASQFEIEAYFDAQRPAGEVLSFNARVGNPQTAVSRVDVCLGIEILQRCQIDDFAPKWCENLNIATDRLVAFSVYVLLGDLPPVFEIDLFAVYKNEDSENRELIATISGSRPAATAKSDDAVSPLLVTSSGRSGSTYLMKLLSAHPKIVCPTVYPYEMRVLTYYWQVFQTASRAADYTNSMSPDGLETHPENVGYNPFCHDVYFNSMPDAQIRDWFLSSNIELNALHAKSSISSYADVLKKSYKKPTATYLAEKIIPVSLVNQINFRYPGCKEIFLVRDCRDMLLSWLSFTKKRSLNPDTEQFDVALELENYAFGTDQLADNYLNRKETCLLVKYEDLVLNQDETLASIGTYLELDGLGWTDNGDGTPRFDSEHATTDSPQDSMGRWRRELSAEENEIAIKYNSKFLETFGYDFR